jgi:hypothetical protein
VSTSTLNTALPAAAPPALTAEQWRAQAIDRFGADPLKWRFVCPSCGHVAAVEDWKNAGASESQAAFSCVGRYTGADDSKTFRNAGGPCTYAGGGLFRLNPVEVIGDEGHLTRVFAFADA